VFTTRRYTNPRLPLPLPLPKNEFISGQYRTTPSLILPPPKPSL